MGAQIACERRAEFLPVISNVSRAEVQSRGIRLLFKFLHVLTRESFAAKTTGLLFLFDRLADFPPTAFDTTAFYSLKFGSKVDGTNIGEGQTQSLDETHSQVTSVHSRGGEIPNQAQLTTFLEKKVPFNTRRDFIKRLMGVPGFLREPGSPRLTAG